MIAQKQINANISEKINDEPCNSSVSDRSFVKRVASIDFPSEYGDFIAIAYNSEVDKATHLAIAKGKIDGEKPVLVRLHSECMTGDVFATKLCDCGQQLQKALHMIEKEGNGVLLYLRQEGRGIGLDNKIRALELQELGVDSAEANLALGFPVDLRDYKVATQILLDLGVRKIRLMTNNPDKINGLTSNGLEVVERVPIQIPICKESANYFKTKRDKMGHLLDF